MVTAIPTNHRFEVPFHVMLPGGAHLVGATALPAETRLAADVWAVGSVGLERRAA